MKALIIDDEKDLLDIIKERLDLEGYDVATATDGEEGLMKAAKYKPNVVICDIMMPKKKLPTVIIYAHLSVMLSERDNLALKNISTKDTYIITPAENPKETERNLVFVFLPMSTIYQ